MEPLSPTRFAREQNVKQVDGCAVPRAHWSQVVNYIDKGAVMPVLPAPGAPTHELGGARFTSLATPSRGSTDTSVWSVELAAGTPGASHRLTREEVFVVLDGCAEVLLDGERSTAGPGDAIVVPPGVPFALAAVGEAPLRAVCCLPVGGQAQLPGGAPFTPPWAR
jgi:quercetin dioxygenase-like cupin family protein